MLDAGLAWAVPAWSDSPVHAGVPRGRRRSASGAGPGQFRSSRRRLSEFAGHLRRSRGLRVDVRTRPALPGLELQLPDRSCRGAVCWLKSTVPARVQDNCCVSGVRGAGVVEPRNRAVETSIDRLGGDYRSFELKNGEDDEACKAACTAENKCRAWTYARAGLCRPGAALLPEKGNQAAAAQGRIQFRGRAVGNVIPGDATHRTSDAQLRIGESRVWC